MNRLLWVFPVFFLSNLYGMDSHEVPVLRAPGGSDAQQLFTTQRLDDTQEQQLIHDSDPSLVSVLIAKIQELEAIVAAQNRSIWRMRMVFIVAGIGFCCAIGKQIYESYEGAENVRSHTYALLRKIRQSGQSSPPKYSIKKV